MSNAATITPAEDRFMRLPEVIQKVGLTRQAIWQLQREDKFPKAVKLTARAIAFRYSDIQRWMDTRPLA